MSGQAVEVVEVDVLSRTRCAQSELRAAVTAVLPLLARGDDSSDSIREALAVLGICRGSDHDLALLAGAVQSAKAFVLLGEFLDTDPEVVWHTYLSQAA